MSTSEQMQRLVEKRAEKWIKNRPYEEFDKMCSQFADRHFVAGALDPTIRKCIELQERAKVYRWEEKATNCPNHAYSFEQSALQAEAELQRVIAQVDGAGINNG